MEEYCFYKAHPALEGESSFAWRSRMLSEQAAINQEIYERLVKSGKVNLTPNAEDTFERQGENVNYSCPKEKAQDVNH